MWSFLSNPIILLEWICLIACIPFIFRDDKDYRILVPFLILWICFQEYYSFLMLKIFKSNLLVTQIFLFAWFNLSIALISLGFTSLIRWRLWLFTSSVFSILYTVLFYIFKLSWYSFPSDIFLLGLTVIITLSYFGFKEIMKPSYFPILKNPFFYILAGHFFYFYPNSLLVILYKFVHLLEYNLWHDFGFYLNKSQLFLSLLYYPLLVFSLYVDKIKFSKNYV